MEDQILNWTKQQRTRETIDGMGAKRLSERLIKKVEIRTI